MTKHSPPVRHDLPRAQILAERAFASIERFLHIEAVKWYCPSYRSSYRIDMG
ncbi:hypothetical protein [Legionella bozemanae]|uniref:Transposase n=1 Tax=Legionella bozemanae TaxID=447 RepID=A0A0W0RJV6_LEGBO|nr:hypothetical protein [Legionella bozemanae]KTC71323.1 hypothetical protein Lboz_2900 [Legionella bozemanae]STO33460.1 Uncharacterised protein [Legionella bozemanae]